MRISLRSAAYDANYDNTDRCTDAASSSLRVTEMAANLLDLFRLVVPEAVVAEIMATDPVFPSREYPYATLFRHLRGQMTVVPARASPPPLSLFGTGEAAALTLAQEQGLLELITEWRAAKHAANQSGPPW